MARCDHEHCGCEADPRHDPYCSAYCANADQETPPQGDLTPEGACSCGHEACTEPPESEPPPPVTSTGRPA